MDMKIIKHTKTKNIDAHYVCTRNKESKVKTNVLHKMKIILYKMQANGLCTHVSVLQNLSLQDFYHHTLSIYEIKDILYEIKFFYLQITQTAHVKCDDDSINFHGIKE